MRSILGLDDWPLGRALLWLALPVIASMISRTIMSLVDFVMISRLGTEAQAAIMPAGVVLFIFISLGMGTLSVVNAFVAQSLGRNRLGDRGSYAWQGLWLSIGFGVLLLPLWWVCPGFFQWVGHEPDVMAMEITYTRIGLLGIGPTLAAVALANFFNGIHRPAIGFWAALAANVLNLVANYALIFGNWGFPRMEMAGAAWATVIAAAFQMGFLLIWMLAFVEYRRVYGTLAGWMPRRAQMARLLRFGAPAGGQFCGDLLAWSVFTLWIIGSFGTAALAAHNLVFRFLEFSFMPAFGMGIALTAAVGKAIGQGDHDRVRRNVAWCLRFTLAYMGLIGLIYLLFRFQLVRTLTDEPEVIQHAAAILILCAVFQMFDAMGISLISALRGCGDNLVPAVVMLSGAAVIFLGGAVVAMYLLPQFGPLGPWGAATLYIIVTGIALLLRFRGGGWKRIRMLQASAN
ncbi:MAG: MATE family efflux transporter [Phycisphaeraceae bacterium]|nr:MATE family efflux transporter [Phycisphaeraceae bacterium]